LLPPSNVIYFSKTIKLGRKFLPVKVLLTETYILHSCGHWTVVLYFAALQVKAILIVTKLMNHKQEVVINNNCSMGVILQTINNEDDDRPPSSRRTLGCAFNNMILPAWIRKA
jgi:hypothetical protein